jgi:hypothetical protein
MGIGLGLIITSMGMILTFTTTSDLAGIDLSLVGVLLMIAGLASVLVDAAIALSRNDSTALALDRVVDGDGEPLEVALLDISTAR